jgi:L-rhamnose mutarotase
MKQHVRRFGSVVGLRPEKRDRYNDLHAHPWPEINAMIGQCNIRNYSIYETEIDGKVYLFSYFEYVGDDFAADMARMAADPTTQAWWALTAPCQQPVETAAPGEWWAPAEEVFHAE